MIVAKNIPQLSSIPTSLHGEERLKNHSDLRKRLGAATCRWMTEINEKALENKENLKENPACINAGIWYPNEHFEALNSLEPNSFENNSQAVKRHLTQKNAHICGYLNNNFFHLVDSHDETSYEGKRCFHFKIHKGVLPSHAIMAAKAGLSIIDCAIACQIARYGALMEVLGERKFNILFGDSSRGYELSIGLMNEPTQPINLFLDFTEAAYESKIRTMHNHHPEIINGTIGNRPVKIGQLVYITGVSTFKSKHPGCPETGYNLICCNETPGAQEFIGLGEKGTEEEISANLIRSYNRAARWKTKHSYFTTPENRLLSRAYTGHTVKFLDPAKEEGFQVDVIEDFNIPLIADLMNQTENQININFVKNYRFNTSTTPDDKIERIAEKILTERLPNESRC